MAYEKKVLDVLDKLVDSIIYEEGRLALINKYGPMLSDEEKIKATELITKQRASLDRLFQIYKSELDPVMVEISETSSLMEPLVEKLLFADKVARNVAAVQEATGENPFNNVEENNPLAMAAKYTETPAPVATEAPVVVETPAPVAVSEEVNETPVETPAPVQTEVAAEVAETPAPVAASEGVSEVPVETPAPVVEESAPVVASDNAATGEGGIAAGSEEVKLEVPAAPATDLVIPAAGESEVHEATADAVESAALGEAATNNVESAAGALSGFVLSPIDEDVAPVPTKEEVKAAEEGVAAADQQLQAVDLMKTEIESNPNLTEEEKKEELQKYTKITEGAVRAILVTKAQYEKLLASRGAQKALLGGEEKKEEAVDAVIPAIAGDVAAEGTPAVDTPVENTATEAAVIPAIVGDSSAEVAAEAPVAEAGDAVVALPTIEDGANVTPPGASGDAILPTIEIPGATPAGGETPNANELQTMIEQGNALYKEGKTEEAESVFNQVSELNQEIQSTIPTVEEAKVLVKE